MSQPDGRAHPRAGRPPPERPAPATRGQAVEGAAQEAPPHPRDPRERLTELEFEQRARLHAVLPAVLSFGFLRRAARRFFGRTLPAAAHPVPRPQRGTLALTFGGHATVMLTSARARIVVDPVFELALHGLPRARQAALDERDVGDTDLVLLTNARRDHLSRSSLAQLPSKATAIVPPGCEDLVADLGFARVLELAPGDVHEQAGARVTAVGPDTADAPGRRAPRSTNGYVVEIDGQIVHIAGDTGYSLEFVEVGRRFAPEIAVLPIGGYQPAPFRREHLSPLDALYAFEDLQAHILVPISYGSFQLSYEPLDEPLRWLRQAAAARGLGDRLVVLEHGQTCLVRARRR